MENKERLKKNAKKEPLAPHRLKLLITVTGRKKAEFYEDYIKSFGCNFQTVAGGRGTAGVEIMALLGLSDSEKSVIFSVISESVAAELLDGLGEKFKTVNDGNGIAFTVPLTGTIGVASYKFLSNMRTED